jgi:cytosine/adenosine deaminase-related metal-dependent hydrolase
MSAQVVASLIVVSLAACSGSSSSARAPAAPEPGLAPPAATPPASDLRTVRRVAVFLGRVGGEGITRYLPDGSIELSYQHVENGRGPVVTGRVRLAEDGTIASFEASGTQVLGNRIDERFTIDGGVARWQSPQERGEAEPTGAAFYVPAAPWPEMWGLLLEALQRAGGRLALLPAGEARLERMTTTTVRNADGSERTLVGWTITGLDLKPQTVWTSEAGELFGLVDDYYSYLEDGWQAAIEPLVALQKEHTAARDAELAARLGRRPPAAGLAIVNARVLDVARRRWLTGHTVVIVGDRITAVGPSKKIKVPRGAEVIDAGGQALLPGLWDMHGHLGDTDGRLNIAAGVTTVRDVGNDPDFLAALKARYEAGTAIGPHVLRAGFIEGVGPNAASSKVTATTEEEARQAVELYAAQGYQGIKIYNSMKPELVPVLARLAHERGLWVSGHVPAFMRAEEVVRAGYDEIQHANMLLLNFLVDADTDTRTLERFTLVADKAPDLDLSSKPVRDFIGLLVRHQTVVDPTLSVFEWMFLGREGEVRPGIEAWVRRLPVQRQRRFLTGGLPADGDRDAQHRAAYAKMLELIRLLHAAKVPIVAGTDALAGFSLHRELELYAAAGIPHGDVLAIATIGAARVMKRDATTGSIARGKVADLVLIDGDPLARIRDVGNTVLTIKAGVVYRADELHQSLGVLPR